MTVGICSTPSVGRAMAILECFSTIHAAVAGFVEAAGAAEEPAPMSSIPCFDDGSACGTGDMDGPGATRCRSCCCCCWVGVDAVGFAGGTSSRTGSVDGTAAKAANKSSSSSSAFSDIAPVIIYIYLSLSFLFLFFMFPALFVITNDSVQDSHRIFFFW